ARIRAAFGHAASAQGDQVGGSLAYKCYSTALWVAFWGFIAAGQAGWVHQAIAIAIAVAVAAIGVTAFICGTALAYRQPPNEPTAKRATKNHFDADAFDVVSRRG